MAFQKLPLSYSVNVVIFVVCLIAFKACMTSAGLGKKIAPILTTAKEINSVLSSYIEKKKTLVLLLDFDGTLSNIVPVPADAKIVPESKVALTKLAKNKKVCVGIISGRLMQEVRDRVQIPNIIYTGNHGLEIEYPMREPFAYQMEPEIQAKYDELVAYLNTSLADGRAFVEDKKYSLTFHYRNVKKGEYEFFKNKAKRAIESYGFKAEDALLAVEGKPPIDWNKDKTVLHILEQEFSSDWRTKVNVIYAGDDKADELVMKVLKGYGRTFRVSQDPIETYGDFRVPNPQTVTMILEALLKIKK
ncbi:probable trehalose-phosphate phosphatase 3 [Contarinia nasturtii]|uniref:probable trehalose-phosphate phosphatase 3 n=1 Tax=Contarinia nasturtii TaxID=265458 RepID=UPI0012D48776|nr:probable trehalose-phosphate phosphatase 3 [Contarinia nasturtii]